MDQKRDDRTPPPHTQGSMEWVDNNMIINLFAVNNEYQNYNTVHNHDLQINTESRQFVYKRFSFYGVQIWNNISKNAIDISYACFKNLSKSYLKTIIYCI